MDLYYLLNYLVIKYSIIENIFLIISSDLLNKRIMVMHLKGYLLFYKIVNLSLTQHFIFIFKNYKNYL